MSAFGPSFDIVLRDAMRVLAEKKLADNEASAEVDSRPHDMAALHCAARVTREELRAKRLDKEALQLAYDKTLEQLGMRRDESGRYYVKQPDVASFACKSRGPGSLSCSCLRCARGGR